MTYIVFQLKAVVDVKAYCLEIMETYTLAQFRGYYLTETGRRWETIVITESAINALIDFLTVHQYVFCQVYGVSK